MYSLDISIPTVVATSLLTTGLNLWLCSYLFAKKEKNWIREIEVAKDLIVGEFTKPVAPVVVPVPPSNTAEIKAAVTEAVSFHFAELLPKIRTEITDRLAATPTTPESPDVAKILDSSFSEISDSLKIAISEGLANFAPKMSVLSAYAQCSKCGNRVARFTRKDDGSVECANCLNGSF